MALSFSNIKLFVQKLPDAISTLFGGAKDTGHDAVKANNNQVYLQILIFLLFAVIAFWVINQVRVNGPIFQSLNEFDALTTDVSSPSIYPVDAFAAYNQAFVSGASMQYEKRDAALENAAASYQAFKARSKYWQQHLSNPVLKEKLDEAISAGENFFFIANLKFKPALLKGAALATGPLQELTKEFELAKVAAESFLTAVDAEHATLVQAKDNDIKLALTGLLLLGLWLLVFMYYAGTKRAARNIELTKQLAKETQENQEAVKLLLNEMGDLADGDLTVKAQVRDSITGAIADSINYTIDRLRDLVVEINRATEQVTSATSMAQKNASKLLSNAETQSVEISQATQTVTGMTESFLTVSEHAKTAATVAKDSLSSAKQGTEAVQNTIAGMGGIRAQIQETAKRMKRLGESSQEISEIVALITDLTEQTNILSLNAAIQAASAGEAGRGFNVVAEEVQRLAERSTEATSRISAIVRTIQTDTNGAVAAMEKSTEGVVEGARLADGAGKALAKIESVTNQLATLIHDIYEETEAQSSSATTVSKNMHLIQSITNEAAKTTQLSADSVVQLNALAKELRYSVAGFKL